MTDQPSLPDAQSAQPDPPASTPPVETLAPAAPQPPAPNPPPSAPRKNWRCDEDIQDAGMSLAELEKLASPPQTDQTTTTPSTQGDSLLRKRLPVWMQELPLLQSPKPDSEYHFVTEANLLEVIKLVPPNRQEDICRELTRRAAILEEELMRLFRLSDYEAKLQQNRYRLYQILYILLAALATTLGGLQATLLSTSQSVVPLIAFLETLVALVVTFLATIGGREPALPLWLTKRRRAEHMRREYFRYLLNLPPFDSIEEPFKRVRLAERVADINRGVYPDEPLSRLQPPGAPS